MKADIMSNSWGGSSYSYGLYDMISAAGDAGILFVAAAGNNYNDSDQYPAYPASYDLDNIISVAATDHNDNKASFSNWGLTHVDLGAPGVAIYSTLKNGSYGTYSGTSMACPHVAGAAGLLKAQYPTLTSEGLKAKLLGGVDIIPSMEGKTVSGGRLNVYNSLIMGGNMSPVADAGGNITVNDADSSNSEEITLDGSGSYDPDGSIISYKWYKRDGSAISFVFIDSGENLNHTFSLGDYLVKLEVEDNDGVIATDLVNIVVNPNQSPIADPGPDQTIVLGATVSFDGSGSSDDGTIVSYNWDFDDGTTGSGMTTTHTYSSAGIYTVILTVTDNGEATASNTTTITVKDVVTDDVTIIEGGVVYDFKKDTLTIKAKSDAKGDAVLTAHAGGFSKAMRYDSRNNIFKVTIRKIFPDLEQGSNPGFVTSSLGGTVGFSW